MNVVTHTISDRPLNQSTIKGVTMEPNKIYIAHDIGKTELTPEQAKELLDGEDLPPNMKKIIEEQDK